MLHHKNERELHMTFDASYDAKSDDKITSCHKNESELHMTVDVTCDTKSDDKSMIRKKFGVTNRTLQAAY
jgi:hypothetical protein